MLPGVCGRQARQRERLGLARNAALRVERPRPRARTAQQRQLAHGVAVKLHAQAQRRAHEGAGGWHLSLRVALRGGTRTRSAVRRRHAAYRLCGRTHALRRESCNQLFAGTALLARPFLSCSRRVSASRSTSTRKPTRSACAMDAPEADAPAAAPAPAAPAPPAPEPAGEPEVPVVKPLTPVSALRPGTSGHDLVVKASASAARNGSRTFGRGVRRTALTARRRRWWRSSRP